MNEIASTAFTMNSAAAQRPYQVLWGVRSGDRANSAMQVVRRQGGSRFSFEYAIGDPGNGWVALGVEECDLPKK